MLTVLFTLFAASNLFSKTCAVSLDQVYNLLLHSAGYFPQWHFVQKLQDDTPENGEQFGWAVSISGDQLVVGNAASTGFAVIYEKENDVWVQKVRLSPATSQDNDKYGRAVDISEDRVIVGAEDRNPNKMGQVWIYEKQSGIWDQAASLRASEGTERFGFSVAISGNYAIVGDYGGDTNGPDAGAAYVFERNADGHWEEVQRLTASDKQQSDYFGVAVDIDNDWIVIGAHGEDSAGVERGAVYVFERNDEGQWNQFQKIYADDAVQTFGRSVSISGDMIVVGTENQNKAFIFERNHGNQFVKTATLIPTGSGGAARSVSISENGEVIVGNHPDDDAVQGTDSGSVSIYNKDINGIWTENKVISPDRGSYYWFGFAVSISGKCAVFGAFGTDVENGNGDSMDQAGAAYIYCHDDAKTQNIEPNGDYYINRPNNWLWSIIALLTVIMILNLFICSHILCSRNNKNGYDVVKMVSDAETEAINV